MFFYFYFAIINTVGEVMSPKKLEEKLKKMALSLKDKTIEDDFPSILTDLEYLIENYKNDTDTFTAEQRIDYMEKIERYKTEYLAELLKKYMEKTWKKSFSYEITDEALYALSPNAYDPKKDIVICSSVGSLMHSDSISDSIKSIIHEYRHQHFFNFLHEKDINGILKYPSSFITMVKDYISMEVGTKENIDNHNKLYFEIDADNYAIEVTSQLIRKLYAMSKNKGLDERVNRLQSILEKQSRITIDKMIKQDRLNSKCIEELYLKRHITSKITIQGNEETDRLLYADKYLMNNPILKDKYEVLNILMDDYSFKDYHKLIIDKYKAIGKNKDHKTKIDSIYDNIIRTTPMVIITKLVEEKDVVGIKTFINNHPTFKEDYKEEIEELFNKEIPGAEILNLLSEDDYTIIKKKGN